MRTGTEIASYSPTRAALADLASKYKGVVYDVTTPKGMTEAKAAKKELAEHRITLEKARVAEKAEALAYGKFVDAEAKKIAEQLAELEDPITAQIEAETKREQREREEKIRLEQERLAAEEAARKKAEEEKLAAERAAIAKERAELEAKQRAQAEEARKAQEKIEAEQRAARQKIEDEERAARAAREEADRIARQAREAEEAKAKAARDAEEARLKAERDRLDAERRAADEAKRKAEAEAEAKAKAIRDAEEAKERERLRQVNELADARAMLATFKQRFGHRAEFAGVVAAIDALPAERKAA